MVHARNILPAAALLGGLAAGPLRAQSPIGVLIGEQSRTTFTVLGAGARASGLGGAFLAVADDATASSFNPAGLAQLLRPEVSAVGRGLRREVSYQDFSGSRNGQPQAISDSLRTHARFDPTFLSGTLPLRVSGRNLVFQLSVHRAFALGESDGRVVTEQSPGGTSELHQTVDQSGQIDVYSGAVAFEASERVLLGLAYNAWRGRWDLDSNSTRTDPGSRTFLAFHQTNRLEGGNFTLGLLWRWPAWSFGLVRRTGFHADYAFDTEASSSGRVGRNPSAPQVEVGLHWPDSTGLGFSLRPAEGWLLTTDLTHSAWSKARFMTPQRNLDGQNFFSLDKTSRTPDATAFRLGAERVLITEQGTVVPLRAGFFRDPQPAVDPITGQQRVLFGLSLGTGRKRGSWTWDAAYTYVWSRRRSSQFLDPDQLLHGPRATAATVGDERVKEQRVDLGLIYRFEREPVERALRYLFVGH